MLRFMYSSELNNRPLLIIIRARINLNNPPGKKKMQAILSKVTGPNNNTGIQLSIGV